MISGPYTIVLRIQNTAYPTPSPKGSMIHGRHSGVSLNFQANIPTAKRPKTMPTILGNVIYPPAFSIPALAQNRGYFSALR